MKFTGKKGILWWLIVAYINMLLLLVMPTTKTVLGLVFVVLLLLVLDIFLFTWTFNNYVLLYEDYLILQFGFTKKSVKLKNIVSVEKSRTTLAGNALSLDRLIIQSRKQRIIISLNENKRFVEELYKINSEIRINV